MSTRSTLALVGYILSKMGPLFPQTQKKGFWAENPKNQKIKNLVHAIVEDHKMMVWTRFLALEIDLKSYFNFCPFSGNRI
jgi:hypothetical protein